MGLLALKITNLKEYYLGQYCLMFFLELPLRLHQGLTGPKNSAAQDKIVRVKILALNSFFGKQTAPWLAILLFLFILMRGSDGQHLNMVTRHSGCFPDLLPLRPG